MPPTVSAMVRFVRGGALPSLTLTAPALPDRLLCKCRISCRWLLTRLMLPPSLLGGRLRRAKGDLAQPRLTPPSIVNVLARAFIPCLQRFGSASARWRTYARDGERRHAWRRRFLRRTIPFENRSVHCWRQQWCGCDNKNCAIRAPPRLRHAFPPPALTLCGDRSYIAICREKIRHSSSRAAKHIRTGERVRRRDNVTTSFPPWRTTRLGSSRAVLRRLRRLVAALGRGLRAGRNNFGGLLCTALTSG